MSKKPSAHDTPTGEWDIDTGAFIFGDSEPADAPVRSKPQRLSLADEPRPGATGSDPYNRTKQGVPSKSAEIKRRSLDDMRQLSNTIKNSPHWTPPQKLKRAKLVQRLAVLGRELERLRSEIKELNEAKSDPADSSVADLMEQLRESAQCLDEALAYLLPL